MTRRDEQPQSTVSHLTFKLVVSVFSAVVGSGLTFGYNATVINNPQKYIEAFISQSHLEQSGHPWTSAATARMFAFIASVYCVGAAVGAMTGPVIASRVGPKAFLLTNNAVMVVGALLSSTCVTLNSYQMLLVGRIITGINNGANTGVCPIYISEIAPKQIRGAAGACFQLSIATGIFIADVLSFDSILGGKDLWPELFNCVMVFALIQCCLLPFCPESPQFLFTHVCDRAAAIRAMTCLRGRDADIEEELAELEEEQEIMKSEPLVGWTELLTTRHIRRPLLIVIVISASQQLSGINGILIYSAPIFQSATSGDPWVVNLLVAGTGLVGIVVCVLAIGLMERAGRKTLMLIGLGGMGVCAMIVSFLLSNVATDTDESCHGIRFGAWANTTACVFIFVYMAFFAIGPSSVPFLIAPEMFSDSARSKAVSLSVLANWTANFMVTYLFPIIQEEICGWVFIIFAGLLAAFFLFIWITLPDVDGLTPGEIEDIFRARSGSDVRRKSTLREVEIQ